MRLRNIPGAREEMLVNPFIVQDPERLRGCWRAEFGNQNPLRIEIGMGKARLMPNWTTLLNRTGAVTGKTGRFLN